MTSGGNAEKPYRTACHEEMKVPREPAAKWGLEKECQQMRARNTRLLGVTAVAAGAGLVMTGTAAAVPPANGNPEVVAAVGSDTIFGITGAIFTDANKLPRTWNTDPDNFVNVPPVLASGASLTVP